MLIPLTNKQQNNKTVNNFCLPEMTCVLYSANTVHALAIQQDRVVETVWTLDRDLDHCCTGRLATLRSGLSSIFTVQK